MKIKILIISCLILSTTGCLGGSGVKRPDYFMLDYPAPGIESEGQILPGSLKIDRFSVVQLFNGAAMLVGTDPFTLNALPAGRWKANPADLVTDILIRDFRNTGLFPAVFSSHDIERARFVLAGAITDFYKLQGNGKPEALLGITVTLLDREKKNDTEMILFQKQYSRSEASSKEDPQELARALSKAMEALSKQILSDVYQTISTLKEKGV